MGIQAVHPVGDLCACSSASTVTDGVQCQLSGEVHDVVQVVHVDPHSGWDVALWRGDCHSPVQTPALLSMDNALPSHTPEAG